MSMIAPMPEVLPSTRNCLRGRSQRWRPWVLMLMAGWYEMRLAAEQATGNLLRWQMTTWRQLKTENKG